MTYKKVGKYNDRVIFLEEVNSLNEIDSNISSGAAILLWLGNGSWEREEFVDVIEKMLRDEAIAICVVGEEVEEQFDLLIKTQGPLSTKRHTMTYMFDERKVEDVLENLFWVVITDSDRWDTWESYLIIVVGAPSISDNIKTLIKEKWND
jgi:hypothetical protein